MKQLISLLLLSGSVFTAYAQDTTKHVKDTLLPDHQLKEIKVSASHKSTEVSHGKMVYNIEKSAAAAGTSAFELLQRTPGVSVDPNDNLLLKGSAGLNVLIDGKMTYLAAQQLSNMLRGMASDNIIRIEVLATPPAQFDASGNAGIINIVTRKHNRQGYAANISAGLRQGHYLMQNENITGNINTGHVNLFGTFGFANRHSYTQRQTSNTVTHDNVTTLYDRTYNDPRLSNYYSYKAGIDWYITRQHQLGFVYNGSYDDWRKNATGLTRLLNTSGATNAQVQNHSVAVEPYYNNAYNVNYLFTIDTTGKRLSADADYISFQNHSDGFIGNTLQNKNGEATEPYQELRFHQPVYITIRSIKTDLDLPLQRFRLKAGLKYAAVTIDNNFRYDSLLNNVYVYAPSLSDYFLYKEQVAAAYMSAARDWKHTSLEMGLRLEHTHAYGRRYANLFPTLAIDQQLGRQQTLSFSLSRRINRPSYAELNPVRYFSDKYAYYSGNPTLKPELAWVFSLSYTLQNKYVATFSYNRLNNFISQIIRLDSAGILISQNANFSNQQRYDVMLAAPVRITSYWETTATTTFSYTTYPIQQVNGYYQARQWSADFMLNQTFTLPGSIIANLVAHYATPELNGIYRTRDYFTLDGGFKKSFLKKKLDLRLSFSDLFHTNRYQGYSLSNAVNYSYRFIPDSRRAGISVLYRLGGKLNNGRIHQIDEQKRL